MTQPTKRASRRKPAKETPVTETSTGVAFEPDTDGETIDVGHVEVIEEEVPAPTLVGDLEANAAQAAAQAPQKRQRRDLGGRARVARQRQYKAAQAAVTLLESLGFQLTYPENWESPEVAEARAKLEAARAELEKLTANG